VQEKAGFHWALVPLLVFIRWPNQRWMPLWTFEAVYNTTGNSLGYPSTLPAQIGANREAITKHSPTGAQSTEVNNYFDKHTKKGIISV